MSKQFLTLVFSLSLVACWGSSTTISASAAETGAASKPVADFELGDAYGAKHSLTKLADRKLVVLAFLGTQCPLAKQYAPQLAALATRYEKQGVAFLGIDSNAQDNITEIKNFIESHGVNFPVLKDVGNVLADQLKIERTPTVLVLDGQRVVRYRGRVDDQYGQQPMSNGKPTTYVMAAPRRADLALALDELLSSKPVSVAQTEPGGCLVGRARPADEKSPVTYASHIAAILNERCVSCHREGQIAPFSLTNYEDAAGWAEMIGEVVAARRMPPWHADPQFGHFRNDAQLSDDQMKLIAAWVSAGAPAGNLKEAPVTPHFASGWMMPEPDEIVKMPKPYLVKAEGTVPYQNFIVDPGWKEDKWVTAMEPKPGNPAVVHHIVMYVTPPPGVSKYYSAKLPKTQLDWFASYAPGLRPQVLPPGTARFVPAGSKLTFQMHYTPNGLEQSDQSYVGIKFADPKTVVREVAVQHAGNQNFRIPPQDGHHPVESTYTFEHDSLLFSMSPHMHVRGKDFRYTLIDPSGRKEVLLNVPAYDFGWQTYYTLAEPRLIPKGSQLYCEAHFDNSENNLNNPDPSKEVRYGPQTWEEMMYGWFEICLPDQNIAAELAEKTQ